MDIYDIPTIWTWTDGDTGFQMTLYFDVPLPDDAQAEWGDKVKNKMVVVPRKRGTLRANEVKNAHGKVTQPAEYNWDVQTGQQLRDAKKPVDPGKASK